MKKITLLLVALLFIGLCHGQKREKVKGSRIVTFEKKEIANFENLEIEDNFEIFLIKGDVCSLEIEADDNLHKEMNFNSNGNTLRLTTLKEVAGFKKFCVKITYTNDFKLLITKHEANVTAITEIDLENFTIKCFDYSKLFANGKIKTFTLMQNDKSKAELNLKSDNTIIELSKNSAIKALISAIQLKVDLYQKSVAVIEGDVAELKLRIDNNSEFKGMNLISKNTEIVAEGNATANVNVITNLLVEASDKSEIGFYGDAKIELKKFTENAIVLKKSLK